MLNAIRNITGKVTQEYRDLLHFVRHDQSTEGRIARATVTIVAAYLVAAAALTILSGLGIISVTYTGSTTALISQ